MHFNEDAFHGPMATSVCFFLQSTQQKATGNRFKSLSKKTRDGKLKQIMCGFVSLYVYFFLFSFANHYFLIHW